MDCFAQLLKAYKVGVPIVVIDTADPFASTERIMETFTQFNEGRDPEKQVRLATWNCAAGLKPLNRESGVAVSAVSDKPETLLHPTMLAQKLLKLAPYSVVICRNMHRHLNAIDTVQAISNLREEFKENGRMLVMLGSGFKIPSELANDVFMILEPLPSEAQLSATIRDMVEGTDFELDECALEKAAAAAIGLTTFAAENLAALAIEENGLNIDRLWSSKRRKIDQTPGLRVVSGCSFDDIGGLQQAKKLLGRVVKGNDAPRAIVFVDEIEKALAGAQGDTSGVAQDQLGTILTYMQEHSATGAIFNGVPGSGKSRLAVAAGASAGIPVIQLDLGGVKGKLVGQSEEQLREALRVISAVSGDRTLWIATANSLGTVPNELRRRFKLGVLFFDLPNREERQKIWELYAQRYDLQPHQWQPFLDREWTGAEIEACCDLAWRMDTDLVEASEFVTPIGVSARESLDALRANAAQRYLSASYPGYYQMDGQPAAQASRRRRLD